VRPGLLLRAAHALAGQPVAGEEKLFQYGGLFYAWREGFVIFSPFAAYVHRCLAVEKNEILTLSDELDIHTVYTLCYTKQGDQVLFNGSIQATKDLPFEGVVLSTGAQTQTEHPPLTLSDAWPNRPLISMTFRRSREWDNIVDRSFDGDFLPESLRGPMLAVLDRWSGGGALLEDRNFPEGEYSLALTAVDTESFIPLPEMALIMRSDADTGGKHPFGFLLDGEGMAYEWDGLAGQTRPWLGEKLTMALAGEGKLWYLSSRETLMPQILGRLEEGVPVQADMVLCMDWRKSSDLARSLLRQAGLAELIPHMNRFDVEDQLLPFATALSNLKQLSMLVREDDGFWEVEGYLSNSTGENHD
jgi:hypothetical protein